MEPELFSHEYFMQQALKEAMLAYDRDEVPVGAIVVANNRILARSHNLTETLNDVTAHAEMQAITAAANALGSKYLNECSLYVSLEPCVMCAGALFWAQVGEIVFGAFDSKRGYTLIKQGLLHPKTRVVQGIMAQESEALLKRFFQKKR
ncbi:MAG: nucleoside deaminase [Bacteroidota bacterium]|nr:MAG: nucleoside deaminase [Bacteroidota bacterium]